MAKRRVSPCPTLPLRCLIASVSSESDLDDVLQISNVFTNVSKGEVAKSNDLQKAFGTSSVADVVKEVGPLSLSSYFFACRIVF